MDNKDRCIDEFLLADYQEGRLPKSEAKTIRRHINQCGACADSLAFYYKASKEMAAGIKTRDKAPPLFEEKAREALVSEKTEDRTKKKERVIREEPLYYKIKSFFRFLIPAPSFSPAFGTATVLLIGTAFLIYRSFQPTLNIVELAGTSTITFLDRKKTPSPSLAFMDDDKGSAKPYEGMTITLKDSFVLFKWEPPNGSGEFQFMLIDIDQKETKVIQERVRLAEMAVPAAAIKKGGRYRWIVSGEVKKGKKFNAEGEFVFR